MAHEPAGGHRSPGSSKGTVQVLLSTYEPDAFLGQLLDSVWAQDYSDISLLVRDDGSRSQTVREAQSFLSPRGTARLFLGEHLGAGRSFLTLLRSTDPTAKYAAFCDQDDVWLPDKVSAAVEALDGLDGPALYCSAVELVDPDLSRIKIHRRCVRGPSFGNALVENIATGCTIVLNRAGIDLIASRTPRNFVMHDAWCYLVLAGCGKVIYDPRPHVLYRLHARNAVGVGTTLPSEWGGRLRRQIVGGHFRALTRQAEELRCLYGSDLTPSAAQCLTDFLAAQSSLRQRLLYAVHGTTHFQRRTDTIAYRLLYAAHRR